MSIYKANLDEKSKTHYAGETGDHDPSGQSSGPEEEQDTRSELEKARDNYTEYALDCSANHGSNDEKALRNLQGWELKKLYADCKTLIANGEEHPKIGEVGTFSVAATKDSINGEWKRRKTLERDNPEQAKAEAEARNEISERTGKPKKAPRGKPFGKGKDGRRSQEQGESGEGGSEDGEGMDGEMGEGSMPPDEPLENPMDEHIRKIARAEDAKLAKAIDANFNAVGKELAKLNRKIDAGGSGKSKTIILKDWDKAVIEIDGVSHEALAKVLQAFNAGFKNVFIAGPAGSGKTTLARQVAEALSKVLDRDMPFAWQQCSVGVTESVFFGRLLPQGDAGQFTYVTTDFVEVYEGGGVFLLDEMDAMDSNVMVAMNSPLENGRMRLPNRTGNTLAVRHEHCYVIAAANTWGHGADRMYVGRNQLDAATLRRFAGAKFSIDYDRSLEASLCDDQELLKEIWRVRDKVREFNIRRVWGTGELIAAAKWRAMGMTVKAAIRTVLGDDWSVDDLSKVGYSGSKPAGAL